MNPTDITMRLRGVRDILRLAGISEPNVRLQIGESDKFESQISLFWWEGAKICRPDPGLNLPKDNIPEALSQIETWARNLPSAETRAQKLAVKILGRAIDECQDAGIDVRPLRIEFAGIYENLLEGV